MGTRWRTDSCEGTFWTGGARWRLRSGGVFLQRLWPWADHRQVPAYRRHHRWLLPPTGQLSSPRPRILTESAIDSATLVFDRNEAAIQGYLGAVGIS